MHSGELILSMETSHILRLRIRLHAGSFHREADMALPAQSSLSEFLDELLALCSAPVPARPWQAHTAAGQLIDASVPLSHSGLRDGDVLLLSPRHELPPPVLLDATEALTEETSRTARTVAPHHLAHAAATVTLLVLTLALSHWFPLWVAFLPSSFASLLLTLWARPMPGVIAAGTACAGCSGFLWIPRGPSPDWPVYALLVGILCAATALTLFGLAARGLPARVIAAALVFFSLALTAGASWFLLRGLPGVAALVLLLSFFAVLASPRLATACVGLVPPRLPSAGQDLGLSDPEPPRPEHMQRTARRARHAYEGIHLGTVFLVCPALLALGITAGHSPIGVGFSTAVVSGYALIFALHGLRHPQPMVLWCHAAVVFSALAALGFLAGYHLGLVLMTGILSLLCIGMPWWLPRLPAPEPPLLLWGERVESLAIAAVIPLSLHLMGVFSAIRGLSL